MMRMVSRRLVHPPNNSFNRSGNNAALIREVEGLFRYLPPG